MQSEATTETQMPSIVDVQISVPIGVSDSDSGTRIDVDLGVNKGRTINRLREGLQRVVARTNNGRVIQTNPDVLRWLSEEISRALARAETGGLPSDGKEKKQDGEPISGGGGCGP